MTVRGDGWGTVSVLDEIGGNPVAEIAVKPSGDWMAFEGVLDVANGVKPLYFMFSVEGGFDFLEFELKELHGNG